MTINKKSLSDRDICSKYNTPDIISSGWDLQTQVYEEFSFTDGQIIAKGKTLNQEKTKRANYVMANPPFYMKEWWDGKLEGDPPKFNANLGRLKHMLYHLAPKGSMALLLANGSMSSNTKGQGEIRETIASTFHAWKRQKGNSTMAFAKGVTPYADIPGFCKSASMNKISEYGYVSMPSRYFGAKEMEDDGLPFAEKMKGLTGELATQFHESEQLQAATRNNNFSFHLVVRGVL